MVWSHIVWGTSFGGSTTEGTCVTHGGKRSSCTGTGIEMRAEGGLLVAMTGTGGETGRRVADTAGMTGSTGSEGMTRRGGMTGTGGTGRMQGAGKHVRLGAVGAVAAAVTLTGGVMVVVAGGNGMTRPEGLHKPVV
jgi:hypothetical protein